MAAPQLLRLPVELHLSVIDKLEFQDTINLAFTNRYFRSIIKPPTHHDYLQAETKEWAKEKGLFACSSCKGFRRFKEFADDMKKGKRSRGGVDAVARLCLKCGVGAGLYTPGIPVVIYGEPLMLCRICGTFPDHVNRQATCTKCSAGSRRRTTGSTRETDRQHMHEHATSRSARVYLERTLLDELYGNWSEV